MTKEEDDVRREHLRREQEAIARRQKEIQEQAAREKAEHDRLTEERERKQQ